MKFQNLFTAFLDSQALIRGLYSVFMGKHTIQILAALCFSMPSLAAQADGIALRCRVVDEATGAELSRANTMMGVIAQGRFEWRESDYVLSADARKTPVIVSIVAADGDARVFEKRFERHTKSGRDDESKVHSLGLKVLCRYGAVKTG